MIIRYAEEFVENILLINNNNQKNIYSLDKIRIKIIEVLTYHIYPNIQVNNNILCF